MQILLQHIGVTKSLRKHQRARGCLNSVVGGLDCNTIGPTSIERKECFILNDKVENVFPLRDASQESSIALTQPSVHVRKLIGSLRDTEQFGVVEKRKTRMSSVKWEHLPKFDLIGKVTKDHASSLSRSEREQHESLQTEEIAQTTPLRTFRNMQDEFNTTTYTTTSHKGRESSDITKANTNLKIVHHQTGHDGHNGHRKAVQDALEKGLNRLQPITTTTVFAFIFMFWGRIQFVFSLRPSTPVLWPRGGCKGY